MSHLGAVSCAEVMVWVVHSPRFMKNTVKAGLFIQAAGKSLRKCNWFKQAFGQMLHVAQVAIRALYFKDYVGANLFMELRAFSCKF